MFAGGRGEGGDFFLRRLLSANNNDPTKLPQPIPTSSVWDGTNLLQAPSNIPSNNPFTTDSTLLSNLLQDYNAALQLVQLQMLIQQQQQVQQPSLENILLAALALQQPLPEHHQQQYSPEIVKTFVDVALEPEPQEAKPGEVKRTTSLSCSSSSLCSSPIPTPPQRLSGELINTTTTSCTGNPQKRCKKRKLLKQESSDHSVISLPSNPSPCSTVTPTAKKRYKMAKKRVLKEDTETQSPVSGMFIKNACDVSALEFQRAMELDDTASYVHISEESRAAISAIPNLIGESVCSLCKVKYEDLFRLAMHRCPRIIHEEYRCPECEKTFSCPANLASHRRWHRPKLNSTEQEDGLTAVNGADPAREKSKKAKPTCPNCSTCFESKSALREHKRVCLAEARELMTKPNHGEEWNGTRTNALESVDVAAKALISLGISPSKVAPAKVYSIINQSSS